MKNSRLAAVAVLGTIAVGIACAGICYYRNYKRACADNRAADCMRAFAQMIGDGRGEVQKDALKPLLDEMDSLSGSCSDVVAESLFTRRLDGAFLLGDYAKAEKMMDDIPERSENWKAGAKAKIRAHAALERGDKAAAIGEFEVFCQTLLRENSDVGECDPCSGVEWSREGLLARNLMRMSALAAEIGDKGRSERYLAEARNNAKIALQKAAADADATAVLRNELGPLLK